MKTLSKVPVIVWLAAFRWAAYKVRRRWEETL